MIGNLTSTCQHVRNLGHLSHEFRLQCPEGIWGNDIEETMAEASTTSVQGCVLDSDGRSRYMDR